MEKIWSRPEIRGETYLNQSATLGFKTPCEETRVIAHLIMGGSL